MNLKKYITLESVSFTVAVTFLMWLCFQFGGCRATQQWRDKMKKRDADYQKIHDSLHREYYAVVKANVKLQRKCAAHVQFFENVIQSKWQYQPHLTSCRMQFNGYAEYASNYYPDSVLFSEKGCQSCRE